MNQKKDYPYQFETATEEEEEDGSSENPCGIGSFRPDWLQAWGTPKVYVVLYTIIGVVQGIYFAYVVGILTTLEKRFGFDSKLSTTITIVDEFTPLIFGIPVGYFAGRTNRARFAAAGLMCAALSSLICSVPYFIHGAAKNILAHNLRNETAVDFCVVDDNYNEQCDSEVRQATYTAVGCLFFGSFLKGFSTIACIAGGLSYMDDNVDRKNLPLYLALLIVLRLLGPTFGFLLSSAFLNYYENPLVDPGFGPNDARWIGAWWLGFVVHGFLLFLVSFPLFFFPKSLHETKKAVRDDSSRKTNIKEELKGLWLAFKRLVTNPVYVIFSVASVLMVSREVGYFIMLPKYMEHQFHLSASQANLISGPSGLVAIQVSSLIGGLLIWKYRPAAKKLLLVSVITEGIGAITYLPLMIPTCSDNNMAGTTFLENGGLMLQNDCNANCNCSTSMMSPLCGPDGTSSYFSPCHAGCTSSISLHGEETFQNCSCVHDANGNFTFSVSAASGFCPVEDCSVQMIAYIIGLIIVSMGTSFILVIEPLILLRSVEPRDKSICLGMFECVLSTFGFIPFPVLYGAMADSSCTVWGSTCGETGNCWFYDMDKFNYLMHGVSCGFAVLSSACFCIIFFFGHRIRDLYASDEEN